MDFHSLSRKELQFLSKRNGVPANITNVAMADALRALEKVDGLDELNDLQQQQQPPRSAVKGSARRSLASGQVEDLIGSASVVSTLQGRVTRSSSKVAKEDGAEKKESSSIPFADLPQTPAPRVPRRSMAKAVKEDGAEKKESAAIPFADLPQTPAPRVPRRSVAKAVENEAAGGGLMGCQVTPASRRRMSLRVRSQTEKGDTTQETEHLVAETPAAVKEDNMGEKKVGRTATRSGYRTRNSMGLRMEADEEAMVVATVEKSRRRSIRPKDSSTDPDPVVQEDEHESVMEVLEEPSEMNVPDAALPSDLTTVLNETTAVTVPLLDAAPPSSNLETTANTAVPVLDAAPPCSDLETTANTAVPVPPSSDTPIGEDIVGDANAGEQSLDVEAAAFIEAANGETLVSESADDFNHQENNKIEEGALDLIIDQLAKWDLSNVTEPAANDVNTVISEDDDLVLIENATNTIITTEADKTDNTIISDGAEEIDGNTEILSGVSSLQKIDPTEEVVSAVMEITSGGAEVVEEEPSFAASEIIVPPSPVASVVPMEITSETAEVEEPSIVASEISAAPSPVACVVPMEQVTVTPTKAAPPAAWQNLLGSFTILDEGSAAPQMMKTPAKSPGAMAGCVVSAKKSGVKSLTKSRGVLLTDAAAGKENSFANRSTIVMNVEASEKMLEKKKKGLNAELENMSMRQLMGLYKKLSAKQQAADNSVDGSNNNNNAEEESNKRFALSPLNRNCLRAPLQ